MAERFAADPTLAATSSYKLAQIRDAIDPPEQWLDRAIEPTGVPDVKSALGNFSYAASNVSAHLTDQVGQASDLLGALADGTGEVDQSLAGLIQSLGLVPGAPPASSPTVPDGTTARTGVPQGLPVEGEEGTRGNAPEEFYKSLEEDPHSLVDLQEAVNNMADIRSLAEQAPKPREFETPAGTAITARTGTADVPELAHPTPGDFVTPLASAGAAGLQIRKVPQGFLRWWRGESIYGTGGPPDVEAAMKANVEYWNSPDAGSELLRQAPPVEPGELPGPLGGPGEYFRTASGQAFGVVRPPKRTESGPEVILPDE